MHNGTDRAASRRQFLKTTVAAGGLFALSGTAARVLARSDAPAGGSAPMRLLILGGTGFIGPHMVEAALAKGWKVTIFNRGVREKKLEELGRGHKFMDKVEVLYGNRDPEKHADEKDPASPKGLESLKGKSFDAVIDNSGYFPRVVKASAGLLAEAGVKHYTFISSISVYAKNDTPGLDESDPVGVISDPKVESMGAQFENYGPLKALCEQAAEAAFPGRCANVRPGFIVGPGDTTDRFTYWPWRAAQGGEMLLPGSPEVPIQFIDARDLAAFCIKGIENKIAGFYNATGPEKPMASGDFFKACIDASPNKPTPVWVPAEFIEKVEGPVDTTIWINNKGESAGFHTRNVSKAVKAGLTFRPVGETIRDTMAWMATRPEERQKKLLAGMSLEREAEVIKAWKESQSKGG